MAGNLPVHTRLPRGIVHAVEHVEEHRAHVSVVLEVHCWGATWIRLGLHTSSTVLLLPSVATAPDRHREGEQDKEVNLCLCRPADALDVQRETEYGRTNNLTCPVENIVQCSCPDVEPCKIEVLELVGVKPVASEEHREQ